jgi:hypothetical protein
VTRLSLLASARVVPCPAAISPGGRPAAPTMADMTQSAGRVAASAMAAAPGRDLDPRSRQRISQVGQAVLVRGHRDLGPQKPSLFSKERHVAPARQRHH